MAMFKRLSGAGILLLGATVIGSSPAVADQVIPDDLIVQGSLCTGLDCVNNEAFGFDTVILKENNTRLLFNDTSVSAGFPANDWRLIANDSAAGGSNFFAIEDATAQRQVFQVTAGARANSIFVASNSLVGFGTSVPGLSLHALKSDTPGVRLEQDTSGGFGAQTWDIAGNEANFFVRDLTGGSRLPFRIRPGAPTSSLDINGTGNVGIGTASPATKLDVTAGRFRVTSNGADIAPPTSGKGVQVTYLGVSDYGLMVSFDNTAGTFKPLRMDGSNVVLQTLQAAASASGRQHPGHNCTAPAPFASAALPAAAEAFRPTAPAM